MKFRPIFFHMPLHLYELNIIQKISRKRLKNLRFTIFIFLENGKFNTSNFLVKSILVAQ